MSERGKQLTKGFEGFSGKTYKCPAGKPTIGWGMNLTNDFILRHIPAEVIAGEREMTKDEADYTFDLVYSLAVKDAEKFLGEEVFRDLTEARQEVCVDMAYNLGFNRLSKFIRFKDRLINKQYLLAALEMEQSKWFKQVGNRAIKLRAMMIEG